MSPKTVIVKVRDFNELMYSLRYRKAIPFVKSDNSTYGGIVNSITVESGDGQTFIVKLLGDNTEYFVRV